MDEVPVRRLAPGVGGEDLAEQEGPRPGGFRRRGRPRKVLVLSPAPGLPVTAAVSPEIARELEGAGAPAVGRAGHSESARGPRRRPGRPRAPRPESAVIVMSCPKCRTLLEHELIAAGELRLHKGE